MQQGHSVSSACNTLTYQARVSEPVKKLLQEDASVQRCYSKLKAVMFAGSTSTCAGRCAAPPYLPDCCTQKQQAPQWPAVAKENMLCCIGNHCYRRCTWNHLCSFTLA